MFTNLSTSGPALSLYPASQRVTFLYYLGRFHFDHGHYLRAHMCFEEAFKQCPPRFQKHRRQILTYWIPANLLLGRFPSPTHLLQRLPEAAGFADIYLPICRAVQTGNFVAFHQTLKASRDYLWEKGLYLTFLYKLKPLLWRSFTRKTFLLTWQQQAEPDGSLSTTTTAANANRAASLSLHDLVTTAAYVQKLLEGYTPVPTQPQPPQQQQQQQPPRRPGSQAHVNSIFMQAVQNNVGHSPPYAYQLLPPPGGKPKHLMPSEGLIFGNKKPDLQSMESVVAGLVYAGLLNGFIARQQKRFAVEGAKRKGGNAVAAGWPNPYESIMERFRDDFEESRAAYEAGDAAESPGASLDEVPGWVVMP